LQKQRIKDKNLLLPCLLLLQKQEKTESKEIKIKKIKSNLRIGPHNIDILSILFGSLLGDAHAEFRLKGNGTRIAFYQEGSHVSYLIWLHKLVSELGYCNINLPQLTTRLGKKGVVRKIIRFKT
jgi:ubiquinol-cytochrome c reductase cytochrome b subunit